MSIFAHNSIDTPAVIWGCHWAGLTVAPSSPLNSVREYAFQLTDSGAKGIVTQRSLLPTAEKAARLAGLRQDRIILIEDAPDATLPYQHFTTFIPTNTFTGQQSPRIKVEPSVDLAFLCYSSGTTGHPKGVMLTHTNIIANILQNRACDSKYLTWHSSSISKSESRGDKIVGFLPFYHIYGLTSLVHVSLYAGLSLIVMPRFSLQKFCFYVQDYRATFANVVPPVILLLAKHPVVNKYDLSSLKMLNCGAAPLTKDLASALYERIRVPVKQGYGLTETSPTTHLQPWDRWDVWGSIGYLLPNQIAKFVDPYERELPVGNTGELWIKGPNVFKGYFKNPQATRNSLSADGFFKTGDIGHVDDQGNFYITDRIKELIKYKGFQVPPAELEGLLLSHPKVNDVAVLGIYDEHVASEIPRAYILPVKGVERNTETEKEICDWLAERVSSYKRLRGGVCWVNEIPRSPTGKILRRHLKDNIEKENVDRAKI